MIPESLIAVLTITFVTSMTQMRKRRVLTRKLSALEALGGITNICSDKTGTLTQGQMTLRKAWIPGLGVYTVSNSEDPSNPKQGEVKLSATKSRAEIDSEKAERQKIFDTQRSAAALTFKEPLEKTERDQHRHKSNNEPNKADINQSPGMVPELEAFLHSAALCNLATVRYNDQERRWQTTGDPTEVALQVFAHRFEKGKRVLEERGGWKQISEYPFDSTVKRMSVVYHSSSSKTIIFTKGAVEKIVHLCEHIGVGKSHQEITDSYKDFIYEQMSLLADQGLRVLALAQKTWVGELNEKSNIPRSDIEKDLTFLGLVGLYDPPRTETEDAIRGTFTIFSYTQDIC